VGIERLANTKKYNLDAVASLKFKVEIWLYNLSGCPRFVLFTKRGGPLGFTISSNRNFHFHHSFKINSRSPSATVSPTLTSTCQTLGQNVTTMASQPIGKTTSTCAVSRKLHPPTLRPAAAVKFPGCGTAIALHLNHGMLIRFKTQHCTAVVESKTDCILSA
jgi:hypothetical protein